MEDAEGAPAVRGLGVSRSQSTVGGESSVARVHSVNPHPTASDYPYPVTELSPTNSSSRPTVSSTIQLPSPPALLFSGLKKKNDYVCRTPYRFVIVRGKKEPRKLIRKNKIMCFVRRSTLTARKSTHWSGPLSLAKVVRCDDCLLRLDARAGRRGTTRDRGGRRSAALRLELLTAIWFSPLTAALLERAKVGSPYCVWRSRMVHSHLAFPALRWNLRPLLSTTALSCSE